MIRNVFLLFTLTSLALAGCNASIVAGSNSTKAPMGTNPGKTTSAATEPSASSYSDMGAAPELENTVWLNTDKPLHIADLRGKVVLLEMWTFECINCQHVQPHINQWYRDYAPQGLAAIGNHFPEFLAERDLNNLKGAVKEMGIEYPIAQDNDGKTWDAYHNAYWPTIYLIDKRGHIRYVHIGEGAYAITEAAIQALLNEPDTSTPAAIVFRREATQ
ncbi:MAG: redoxin domain-containing protein [Anaerolineaceae bacterium]|nr:redoxin domain-containing protein [Anaerolineaceae bacterium]